MEETKAYAAALLNAAIIGFSFLFVSIALRHSNSQDLLTHRFLVASFCIVLFRLLTKKSLRLSFQTIKKLAPIALFFPFLYFSLQTYGLLFVTSSEAGMLEAISPAFAVFFAFLFLKEHVRPIQIIGLFLSISGVILMQLVDYSADHGTSLKGTILILLSVVAVSCYQLLSKKTVSSISPLDISYAIILMGALVFTGLSVSQHLLNDTFSAFLTPFSSPGYLLSILYLGILSTFGTSILTIFALSKIPMSNFSVFNNFSTLLSILAGVFLLKENFSVYHILGAVLILLGVYFVSFAGKRKNIELKQEQ